MRIQAPWRVTAYGAAGVKAAPDLARVKLALDVVKDTPKEAFEAGQAGIAALLTRGVNAPIVDGGSRHLGASQAGTALIARWFTALN